jgi:transcriptional regulator with XRE-family HTH domain
MQPAEIKARCRAIGLDQKRLAALAGLHKTTIERTFNKKSRPLHDTIERIVAAMVAQEKCKRDELVQRHGLPDLPECDSVLVDGVMRRIVKPTVSA